MATRRSTKTGLSYFGIKPGGYSGNRALDWGANIAHGLEVGFDAYLDAKDRKAERERAERADARAEEEHRVRMELNDERLRDIRKTRADAEAKESALGGALDNVYSYGGRTAGEVSDSLAADEPSGYSGQIRPGSGALTDGLMKDGEDKGYFQLGGAGVAAGADALRRFYTEYDGAQEARATAADEMRARMGAGLTGYISNAGSFPTFTYQDAMEGGFGESEWNAHGDALNALRASTGMDIADVGVTPRGDILTFVDTILTDGSKGRGAQITLRKDFEEASRKAGRELKWDEFSKRYMGVEEWGRSRTAFALEIGEALARGMTFDEFNAEYDKWKAEKEALARRAETDAIAADERAYRRGRDALEDRRRDEEAARTIDAYKGILKYEHPDWTEEQIAAYAEAGAAGILGKVPGGTGASGGADGSKTRFTPEQSRKAIETIHERLRELRGYKNDYGEDIPGEISTAATPEEQAELRQEEKKLEEDLRWHRNNSTSPGDDQQILSDRNKGTGGLGGGTEDDRKKKWKLREVPSPAKQKKGE